MEQNFSYSDSFPSSELYTNLSSTNLTMEQIISFMQAEKEYLADNSR